jgi:hypothetical protein
MISKITGREFDETKYRDLRGTDLVRAQIEDGVMMVDETEARMRELDAEIAGAK